jgi:hypothetical protein
VVQTLTSVVGIGKVEDEQNSENFNISNGHLSHTKNGKSRRTKGRNFGKKEHSIFMQDSTYGIFGSCYNGKSRYLLLCKSFCST